MARSRNIKPGLAKNEVLAELGPQAQLLFAVLPCLADKAGRMEDRPKRIKAEVFPYYEADVDRILQSLADCEERFIVRYEIAGTRYLQITNFERHQTPHHKETESTIPPPPKHDSSKAQASPKHDDVGSHAPVIGIRNQESGIKEEESVELERIGDERLREGARGWLLYKAERRERYKPQGLRAFIGSVMNNAESQGVPACLADIQESMGNGYRGVVWGKSRGRGSPQNQTARPENQQAIEEFMSQA